MARRPRYEVPFQERRRQQAEARRRVLSNSEQMRSRQRQRTWQSVFAWAADRMLEQLTERSGAFLERLLCRPAPLAGVHLAGDDMTAQAVGDEPQEATAITLDDIGLIYQQMHAVVGLDPAKEPYGTARAKTEEVLRYPWAHLLPDKAGPYNYVLLTSLSQMSEQGRRLGNCFASDPRWRDHFFRKARDGDLLLADFQSVDGQWRGTCDIGLPTFYVCFNGPNGGRPSKQVMRAAFELSQEVYRVLANWDGPRVVVEREVAVPEAEEYRVSVCTQNGPEPQIHPPSICHEPRGSGRTTRQLHGCHPNSVYVVLPQTLWYTLDLVGFIGLDVAVMGLNEAADHSRHLRSIPFVIDHAVFEAAERELGPYANALQLLLEHNRCIAERNR